MPSEGTGSVSLRDRCFLEKPNRKAGERPARSRHCKTEQFRVYATGHVAGKVRGREEVEPGELPAQRSPFDLRGMGKGIERQDGCLSLFSRKAFLFVSYPNIKGEKR